MICRDLKEKIKTASTAQLIPDCLGFDTGHLPRTGMNILSKSCIILRINIWSDAGTDLLVLITEWDQFTLIFSCFKNYVSIQVLSFSI